MIRLHSLPALLALLAAATRGPAQPTFEMPREPRPVPDRAALAAAESRALPALADRLVAAGGSLPAVQQRLFEAAARATDDATRFLLMWEAVAVAERAGRPELACNTLFTLEAEFAIDRQELLRALLQRMAGPGCRPTTATAVALTARFHAGQSVHLPRDAGMLALFDIGLRAAIASGDPWLHAFVRDELPELRDVQRTWSMPAAVRPPDEVMQILVQWPELLGPVEIDDLACLFDPMPAELRGMRVAEVDTERLIGLAEACERGWVRRGLLRAARQLAAERWSEIARAEERAALAGELRAITEALAADDGVTRLRFRTGADLRQLVLGGGQWRIEDGALVGKATGSQSLATHRLAFRQIRSVVFRGGIRKPGACNFRCLVGEMNLLLNWEVRPENHLWCRGQRREAGPPALEPGREHAIALHATPAGILVFVDDRHWFTAPGTLAGTVTVYPALGSEIFVREILIDGEPALQPPVPGPVGEPK